jgi:hypothetical protein
MAAKAIAVLKLSNKVNDVIAFAQAVATSMAAAKTTFPAPVPTITAFQADIASLVTSETAAMGRTKGAVETRNAKLEVVKGDLENLRSYVQTVADAANPTNAAAIIESSGMNLRAVTLPDKSALKVRQGLVSGAVLLMAKAAGRRATYTWQYSSDQKTWTTLPQTLEAKTSLSGLTSATTYYFRVQALLRTGQGNWGEIVSFLVK